MKHNLIKTDNYLLGVDDSEIKSIDWVYVEKYPEAPWKFMNPPCPMPYWGNKQEAKKIIVHLPLNGAPYIDGLDVLPPSWRDNGEDVYKLVKERVIETMGNHNINSSTAKDMIQIGIDCYNKAREKYKFTEKDARQLIMYSFLKGVDRGHYSKEIEDRIIQTIQQAKIPIAFECEMEPKFKHIGSTKEVKGSGSKIKNKYAGNPKTIINSEGRTEWVGKYIYN